LVYVPKRVQDCMVFVICAKKENLELFRKWYEVLLEVNCLNFTITHSLNFKEAVLFVVLIVLNNMNWK